MGGYATLDELRNAPAGTLFRERRRTADAIRLDNAEYRTVTRFAPRVTGQAARPAMTVEGWLRQLEEAGFTEPLKG
jgi:hypothetical protein